MKALISGNKGQDGYYLTELLLSKGYEVYGFDRFDCMGGAEDEYVVDRLISRFPQLSEIYNLAGITKSEESFEHCRSTFEVNTLGALNMLELARRTGARVFQASSAMQNGLTPYGISKLAAHKLTQMYREVHGIYAVSGIMHNHVSPRCHGTVINKLVDAAKKGKTVKLGNISAARDWIHAKDAVKAMWLTLQQPKADDYEIGRGEAYRVAKLAEYCGLTVEQDMSCVKRGDQEVLYADPTKLKALGWEPTYSIFEIIDEMM